MFHMKHKGGINMAYNQEYPYVDAQMFNIDWVLAKIKELDEAINVDAYKFIGENVYTDWNQAQPQTITYIPVGSLALNQAMEGSSGMLFTNGTPENLEQRFYAFSSGDMWYRSARNGVWLMWTNKDDDSSYFKGLPQSSTFNANNAEPNTYLYAYGNPANFPSGVSAGLCINYKTLDNGILQAVYPTVGTDFWKRIKTNDGVWGQWMNVNDYSNFFKRMGQSEPIDANTAIENGYYWADVANSQHLPNVTSLFVLLLNFNMNDRNKIQLCIDFNTGEIWKRDMNGAVWRGWTSNNLKAINSMQFTNADTMALNSYQFCSNMGNTPATYGYLFEFDSLGTSNVMQLFIPLSGSAIYARNTNNKPSWSNPWRTLGTGTNALSLLSTQHTDLYSTALSRSYNTMSTDESTKGSSFMHADTGYESFSDAILRRDLSDKDMVVTNLEMWDMDTPINELTARVSEVVTHIKETSPLTKFTLYSLPPIDVPFFGEELYTYVWPSGNTLTEVDDALLALSAEMGFKYVTWREYEHINDNNLLSLYDDLFNNDLYKHSLQSYIADTI